MQFPYSPPTTSVEGIPGNQLWFQNSSNFNMLGPAAASAPRSVCIYLANVLPVEAICIHICRYCLVVCRAVQSGYGNAGIAPGTGSNTAKQSHDAATSFTHCSGLAMKSSTRIPFLHSLSTWGRIIRSVMERTYNRLNRVSNTSLRPLPVT